MSKPSDAPLTGHVIVCGLGHVGYRTVKLLIRLGERGIVITRQLNEDWRRVIEPHFCVIVGDARDDKLLDQASVSTAKAVLIVTDDDLANLSIALDARRMNPRAVLIVRQFDQELAVHLEQSVEIDRALSASALAAPSFAVAALGTTVQCSFSAGSAMCHMREESIDVGFPLERCTVGQWSAGTGQAALAIRRGQQLVFPCSADTPLLRGDRIVAIHLASSGADRHSTLHGRERRGLASSALQRFWTGIRQWWHEVPVTLRAAMIALVVFVLISVGVFHTALGMPLVDALYFVVTTITTVGYGDYNLMEAPPAVKLYGVFVMLCGAAILTTIFGLMTDFILRTRLRDMMVRGAAHYRNHIIVAGLGNIGFRLVRDLVQAGESVVAIEHRSDAPYLQAARELAPVVVGNAKTEETLRRAGVAGAKAVLAVTDDDLSNLSTALAVKRIHPECRTVLRIFSSELAEKLQAALAMDAVLSVSGAAAPTFVGAVLCPQAVHGFVFGDWLLVMFRQVVGDDCGEARQVDDTMPENQSILFIQRAGAAGYETAAIGNSAQTGDEILGVRWYPLTKKR